MSRARSFSFEAATIGTCNHTKHRHGWWCVRCLMNIAPGGADDHPGRGEWRVRIGPAEGFGVTRTKAWQAALEALLMADQLRDIHWPDAVPCVGCGHPQSTHCSRCGHRPRPTRDEIQRVREAVMAPSDDEAALDFLTDWHLRSCGCEEFRPNLSAPLLAAEEPS